MKKKYPSWEEWHEQTFPDAKIYICPKVFNDVECGGTTCSKCRKKEIPEDVAMKLGIQPKEAGK